MRGRDHGVRLTFYGTDLLRADRPSGDVPRGDHGDGHCGILPRHDADRQRLRAAADTGADRIGGPRHRHRHRAGHGGGYLGGERRLAQPDAAGAILLYGGGRDAGVVAAALGHRTVVVGRGAGRDGAEAVCPRAAGGDADRLHPRPVPVLQRHGGGPCSPRPAQGSRHQPAGYGGGTQLLRGAGDAGGVPRAGGPAAVPALPAAHQLPSGGQQAGAEGRAGPVGAVPRAGSAAAHL